MSDDELVVVVCPLCRRALGPGMQAVLFSPRHLAPYVRRIGRPALADDMTSDPENPVALCLVCGIKAQADIAATRTQ